MLGALSLKWKWREHREAAGKPVDRPNLVFGGDVHVVFYENYLGKTDTTFTLEERGRLHPTVRKRVHSNTRF